MVSKRTPRIPGRYYSGLRTKDSLIIRRGSPFPVGVIHPESSVRRMSGGKDGALGIRGDGIYVASFP